MKTDINLVPLMPGEDNTFSGSLDLMTSRAHTLLRDGANPNADDRRRKNIVLSCAIVCNHDLGIADDHRSVFPYDRRRSQNFLRSAVRDRLR